MSYQHIGVDGCPGGWFWVGLSPGGRSGSGIVGSIRELLETHGPELLLIDIPIGLHTEERRERRCDRKARELLGQPRGSSVFPVPCRPAVYTDDVGRASEVNEKYTGRRLSEQSVNLIPKIREVDRLLRDSEDTRSVVRECHPELCFWALNGGEAVDGSKKDRDALLKRFQLLQSVDSRAGAVTGESLLRHPRSELARDDVLDALAAAVTASHPNGLNTVPSEPEHDEEGLPMEMVYWSPYGRLHKQE